MPFNSYLIKNISFHKFRLLPYCFFIVSTCLKCITTKANKALRESMLHHKAINKGSRTNQATSCISFSTRGIFTRHDY